MKKIFAKLCFVCLFANFALCFDDFGSFSNGSFVGFEGAYTQNSFNKERSGYVKKYTDSAFLFGLKAGLDANSYRLYGQININTRSKDTYADRKIAWRSQEILANGDWTPQISPTFKALVGGFAGLGIFQIDEKFSNESVDSDKIGLLMGLKLGAIVDMDFNKAIEFGWKVDKTFTGPDITKNSFFAGFIYKFN